MKSSSLPFSVDRVTVGAINGEAYTIFDPPWWKVWRWCWWIWMVWFYNGIQLIRLRIADVWKWIRRKPLEKSHRWVSGIRFEYGTMDFRYGGHLRRVRIYRVRGHWVVWVPTFD